MPRKSTSTPDRTAADTSITDALARVASQFSQKHGELAAYTCTMTLPKQFSEDAAEANELFRKIQSDFCKSIMRGTGTTPRYVAIRTNNEKRPEYRFALFTPAGAPLENPEEYADHGRAIANTKCCKLGWSCGKLDVVEMLMDAPTVKIHAPIRLSGSNRYALNTLESHLGPKADAIQGQRSLFVSKTEKAS